MDANQLAATVTALAIAISDTHTPEETTLLASIFVQLGDTLTTLATKRAAPAGRQGV
ncbi:MAG: hypothetical protein Q3Y08_04375 [Butyricicoccus sp.]|nr:hypothetical protein [Butyricicoccus sp.]